MVLDLGVSPNEQGGELRYPIFAAIARGNAEVLGNLLSAGADVSVIGRGGKSPLHYAAESDNYSLVRLLIAWKADVEATADGDTPLVSALRALPRAFFQTPGYKRKIFSPVMTTQMSVAEPNPEIIRLLLSNGGTDIMIVRKAFAVVIEKGFLSTAVVLLQESEQFPINLQDSRGNTLLHLAAESGTLEIARLLLDAGADETIPNNCGHQAMHLAATPKKVEMLKFMVKVQSEDYDGDHVVDGVNLECIFVEALLQGNIDYLKLLFHLVSVYPTDHIWHIHLALFCFSVGDHLSAAELREKALRLNPQNDHVTFLEHLAQSVECEMCGEPILGRHWICRSCCIQLCAMCHARKRRRDDCSSEKWKPRLTTGRERHYFMGFPGFQCSLRTGPIDFKNDRFGAEYSLMLDNHYVHNNYIRSLHRERSWSPRH